MTKPSIDLSTLDTVKASNRGYDLELLHPATKEPLGQFITILGKDSDAFKEYTRDTTNEKLRSAAQARRTGRDMKVSTVEDSEREGLELLVVCTIGFKNIQFNGEFSYSPENAFKLYSTFPWIKEQVDAAIVDTENFMKNLPKK